MKCYIHKCMYDALFILKIFSRVININFVIYRASFDLQNGNKMALLNLKMCINYIIEKRTILALKDY